MQQYGFVQQGGNTADRIEFPEALLEGEALSLPRIEGMLGDAVFAQMMAGQHRYLTAALKSLPLRGDAAKDPGGSATGDGGLSPGSSGGAAESALAARLLECCDTWLSGV